MNFAGVTELRASEPLHATEIGAGSERLAVSYPALAESVAQARSAAGAFAAAAGASSRQLEDIRLLVSEAVTNAVQHAYSAPAGCVAAVHLTGFVAARELWIFVADDGCGLRAEGDGSSEGLGLGLVWMTAFSDELTLHTRASGGLEVRLRFHLSGGREDGAADQLRGSLASARRPTSPSFSTTT